MPSPSPPHDSYLLGAQSNYIIFSMKNVQKIYPLRLSVKGSLLSRVFVAMLLAMIYVLV